MSSGPIYNASRPHVPERIREDLLVESGSRCSVRRCTENFTYYDIHHINFNREDNRPENLIVLCLVHHRMAHDKKMKRSVLQRHKLELKRDLTSIAFVRSTESDRAYIFKEIVLDAFRYQDCDEYRQILTEAGYDFPMEIYFKLKDIVEGEVDYEQRLRSHDPDLRSKQDEVMDLIEQLVNVIDDSKYRVLADDFRFIPDAALDTQEYWNQVERQNEKVDSLVFKILRIMQSIAQYASARF
ncbi:hypothetical protein CCOS865_02248 [Pseudomonas reidholzensis]|uniref:HNH nuclease domain-containing protein n=1 Tax=Pseudomonas reidholzensis TaxID=1785162 RepID=A0A383RSF2_9PSED|nr:HNH endonuclease signature motif containing protein [Pseudomonas reidholzensis]SYX89982.1 hypothetical protein CCOS865_02248 [Pseudomonas reidholzensis]